jgi:hypothetical protein
MRALINAQRCDHPKTIITGKEIFCAKLDEALDRGNDVRMAGIARRKKASILEQAFDGDLVDGDRVAFLASPLTFPVAVQPDEIAHSERPS